MDNTLMLLDQYDDFMDPLDDNEDIAAMFGQSEFDQNIYYWSPEPFLDPPHHNPSNFSTLITHDRLNFLNQNPWDQQQVNTNAITNVPEEILVVPELVDKSRDGQVAATTNSPRSKKRSRKRPASQTYDHIMAERRRRELLGQLFVSLSALVPGLKKMDKSSVLEDAIKYLKELQERVKKLEEKAQKQGTESTVLIKKSQIVWDGKESLSDDEVVSDEQPLPEIEARFCDGHILVRVHCEKQKGILVKLLSNVESLNVTVVNANATSFGTIALDITIIAEMEKEFNLTAKEVVAGVGEALR